MFLDLRLDEALKSIARTDRDCSGTDCTERCNLGDEFLNEDAVLVGINSVDSDFSKCTPLKRITTESCATTTCATTQCGEEKRFVKRMLFNLPFATKSMQRYEEDTNHKRNIFKALRPNILNNKMACTCYSINTVTLTNNYVIF